MKPHFHILPEEPGEIMMAALVVYLAAWCWLLCKGFRHNMFCESKDLRILLPGGLLALWLIFGICEWHCH